MCGALSIKCTAGTVRNMETGSTSLGIFLEEKKNHNQIVCKTLSTNGGEGNGTPLQYSCLESPMDGGPWWAAVHGVAKVRHD